MIINRNRFRAEAVHTVPFTWAEFTHCVSPEDGRRLVEHFPSDRLELRTSSAHSDKQYTVRSLTVYQDGRLTSRPLPPVWAELVDDISSADFTTSISRLSGVDVGSAVCEIRLTEHEQGFSMSPHTDRADKLVTLVFYLGLGWSPGDGGELAVLRSKAAHDVHSRVAPVLGSCAMMVRSDASWHCVEPPTRPGAVRRAVLAHFTH